MPRPFYTRHAALTLSVLSLLVACGGESGTPAVIPVTPTTPTQPVAVMGINKLNHVVVIYLENRSFDHLYGEFAGARGIADAASAPPQLDARGAAYVTLPQPADSPTPAGLPNAPYSLDRFVSINAPTRSLVHQFYEEQRQINGGRMDHFVSVSDGLGFTMGYYHTAALPLAKEAAAYTLCDAFFHASYGGSFLNHIWAIAAATPVFPHAPATQVVTLDAAGNVVKNGAVTPDGFVVNNLQPTNSPHAAGADAASLVPNQVMPTIGDRLSDKNVDWAWYAEGWNDALAGRASPAFAFHHQPFVYFARYADGTSARAAHLKDMAVFDASAVAGTLPAVSFIEPLETHTEHPGNSIIDGELEVLRIINEVRNGLNWRDTAIIITYDENGGFWDHVAPPTGDRWGPATRVPTIVISPFARRNYVDHSTYDTTSILALIETRWGLAPLSTRDAAASNMTAAFDFTQ